MTRGAAPFTAAAAALPTDLHEAPIAVAGHPAVLRVVGGALAERLAAAFAPRLPDDHRAPVLEIELWDRSRTCMAFPPPDTELDRTWSGIDQRLLISGGGRRLRLETPGGVTLLDRGSGRIVGSRERAADLAVHETAQPVSELLVVWLHDRGIQRVHAAAVACGGEALVVAGPGGSGKSTFALACALGGWAYLGDDKIGLVEESDGAVRAFALYASASADASLLTRHPELVAHAAAGKPKSVVAMGRVPGVRLEASARVRAVLVPRVGGDARESTLSPISPAAALRSLAPSSLIQPFGAGRPGLELLARVVQTTPCFSLELGRDPAGILVAAETALARAEAAA